MKKKATFNPPLTGVYSLGTEAFTCVLPTSGNASIQSFSTDNEDIDVFNY